MTKQNKPVRIEFAPGAFDHFDGTQEELDALVAEIQDMFANKTVDELKEMSQPLTHESFEELPEEVKRSLLDDDYNQRTLQ
jgi:hypothetical protein